MLELTTAQLQIHTDANAVTTSSTLELVMSSDAEAADLGSDEDDSESNGRVNDDDDRSLVGVHDDSRDEVDEIIDELVQISDTQVEHVDDELSGDNSDDVTLHKFELDLELNGASGERRFCKQHAN